MSKIISEENPEAAEAAQSSNAPQPGGGAKDRIRKQARQLAYDTRYKVKKNFAKGQKTDAVALKRAYLSQLQKSPAPGPVKELAKKMLVGEEYDFTDVSTLITDSVNLAFNKVFVKKTDLEDAEGNLAYEVIDFVQEASSERKYQVRVTDKESKKTYVRMATREKIAQLRSNPKISSVEMTGHGDPYEGKKKADKDYDGDGKKESPTAEYKGSRDKAIKKSIAKEEFIDEVNDAEDDNPDANVKKIDVMKGKNKIKISPTQSEAVDPATSNKKEPDAGVANKEKRVSMMKRQILQKKMQAVRSGAGADIVAHHEPEGDVLTEEFINESVDFATEYFYKEGLNEEGLDLVIEDVGIDEFTEFVLGLQEDLNEERSAERAKPRDYAKVKASVDKTDAKHKAAGTREYSKSAAAKRNYGDKPAPEGKPEKKAATKKKVEKSVAKAKKAQPAKPISKPGLGSKIRSAVSKGVERHKAATKKASGQVKKIAKTASDTAKQHAGHRKKFVSGLKATPKEKKIASGVGKAVKKALTREELEVVDEAQQLPANIAAALGRLEAKRERQGTKKSGKKLHPSQGKWIGPPPKKDDVKEDAKYGYDSEGNSLNPKDIKKKKKEEEDYRGMKTKVNLVRNKLRAMGLNMSQEPEGEVVEKYDNTKSPDYEKKKKALAKKHGGADKVKGHPQYETYTVTAADKAGNTPAYQAYKAGKKNVKTGEPLYKAADHLKKNEAFDAEKDAARSILEKKSDTLATEAKVDTVKKLDDEGKEDARNLRKYGTKHNQFMQAVRRRGEHRSERSVKKIKGQKPAPKGAYGEETVLELNRYGKETGKATGSLNKRPGTPVKTGGDPSPVMRAVRSSIRRETGKPEGQQKKEKGKKPPVAGEYGARRSPAQIIAKRRASKASADAAMRDTRGT